MTADTMRAVQLAGLGAFESHVYRVLRDARNTFAVHGHTKNSIAAIMAREIGTFVDPKDVAKALPILQTRGLAKPAKDAERWVRA